MAERRRASARAAAGGLAAGVLALLLGGCGLLDIRRGLAEAEALGQIEGRVESADPGAGPLRVVLFQQGGSPSEFVIIGQHPADADGRFRVPVVPGEYFVGAYQDGNGDADHQRNREFAGYHSLPDRRPQAFAVGPAGRVDTGVLRVTGLMGVADGVRTLDGSPAVTRNIGRVVSLDDPMFAPEQASLGLWQPVEFLRSTGGGLFMLQPYEPDRVPVIFVHGIGGTPRSFAPLVAALDRSRFQPWILYYPSGLRLDVVSNYLDRALELMVARHRPAQVVVIAHSMGGLVARAFVLRHAERGRTLPIALLMTINSPMGGLASAARGVDASPLVVPSWRDVAADSDFVRSLYSGPWPAGVPYHLVFGWLPDGSSDGVVPLSSQLPADLQAKAARVRGFEASHVDILADPGFVDYFATVLASVPGPAQPRPLPRPPVRSAPRPRR